MVNEEKIINFLNEMKSFKDTEHIPSVPKVSEEIYKKYVIPNYIRCGAIPKKNLVDGLVYEGDCRNASCAKWISEKNQFVYKRYKFGNVYDEYINHFEDDDGYDLFVPLRISEE